ncbi:MAG: dolichyl-phosphate beta-D-mannosyltransferase [Deltaproteobacteria bacterium RIFOXYA12_FULL_58_15]|nr:MAG: dolichyl-phosphate beta-D-mannosyltransferase [Deltaproteobacteria bacterium RIFOXYA12_FULL_58_15]OGR11372.1 MAG: dolichyl-phosphate beta-D-mannosyltransferase [Deltaproteobacteria bacterium RIFOXYB12_FULL_58_9]
MSPRSTNACKAVVLLPTYNERENLSTIVPEILAAAPVDVWIFDDNSPDGTGEIADGLADGNERILVTHRCAKLGLGAAYLDGFRKALDRGYERILEMDADFSHPPANLPELLRLTDEYDLVLGSRWVPGGGTRNWPWYRRLISRGGSWYARTCLGVGVHDLTGGFKCFRREVLEAIDFESVRTTGYAFQIEMTFRAIQRGFRVVETPITFVEREHGTSKMSRRIVLEAILKVPGMRIGIRK